jgi:D-aminopeptidase
MHVLAALAGARAGPVEEGSVGAGTGTIAFGWKGGIGTSSRRLPSDLGGWTVGVLVQSNFGGVLMVAGVPVGLELGRYPFQRSVEGDRAAAGVPDRGDGSIMIVVATDAPLDSRNLGRLAERAVAGLARTGAVMTHGSGDYVIAFSTAEAVRRPRGAAVRSVAEVPNDGMSGLFQAVAGATEEAILNSLFRATTVEGNGVRVEALPLERVLERVGRRRCAPPPDRR